MWERLAFYTMVGILLLYTIDTAKGGLGLPKVVGNEIYGLYLAFVYFTPYIGGLLADRFLGYRRSVFIGGCFFALGFFLMGIYGQFYFTAGLVCLCVGNGFFKPNISVMVGNLYESGDPKRDAGFSIFYMGINIGAFIANYLAAWVLVKYGWLWIFWVAGMGMFIGLGVLLASWKILEKADRQPEIGPDDVSFGRIMGVILLPSLLAGAFGYFAWGGAEFLSWEGVPADWQSLVRPASVGMLIGMMPILIFFVRLGMTANEQERPGLLALLPVYLAGATFFMVLHLNGSAMTTWAKENTDRAIPMVSYFEEKALPEYYSNAGPEEPRPNRQSLVTTRSGEMANKFGQQRIDDASLKTFVDANQATLVAQDLRGEWPADDQLTDAERLQKEKEAGWALSAVTVYDKVKVEKTTDSHGHQEITVSAEDGAKKLKRSVLLRTVGELTFPVFVVTESTFSAMYDGYYKKYGEDPEELPPGEYMDVAQPVLFQSLNAMFVILFTPFVVAFFSMLVTMNRGLTTPQKIFWGMLLTTLSLVVMGVGGLMTENGAIKGSAMWLVGFYAIVTLGELCLSPMALSLVTKLSPKRFVGLTMGGWFIATAFGNNFSGFFGGVQSKMDPAPFFFLLAGITAVVTLFILALLPKLNAAMKKYGA